MAVEAISDGFTRTGGRASTAAPAVAVAGSPRDHWVGLNGQQAVMLVDSSGGAVAVGAGTQYTEGDVDTTITGTAVMWEDASDVLVAASAAKPLPVADATGNTALAAIKTAAEIIDNAIAGSEMQVDVVAALPAGTNAIGKLAANSGVDIGDVDIASIAAGDNNIGNVDIVTLPVRAATTDAITAKLATDAIMNGLTALTPKFAIIDFAASGDNELVASVSAKKIRVLALFLVSAGTVNVRFESGAGGTALTGVMNLIANSGFTLPFCPVGWFETAATTALNLELSAAVSVDGSLVYVEV